MQHEQRIERRYIDHLHMPTISGNTMDEIMNRLDGIVAAVIFGPFEPEQIEYPCRVRECGIVVVGGKEIVQSCLNGRPEGRKQLANPVVSRHGVSRASAWRSKRMIPALKLRNL